MPAFRSLCHLFAAVAVCSPLALAHAADDSYLDLLDQEVTKVEAGVTDTPGVDGAATGAVGNSQSDGSISSRDLFENELRDKHVGTYSFYRKLPERSREEIYVDFTRGASLEALREKIIERYLHP